MRHSLRERSEYGPHGPSPARAAAGTAFASVLDEAKASAADLRGHESRRGTEHESMPKRSAGVLMFRRAPGLELLLVHPGGPFFRNKDAGAWTVPKGEIEGGDAPLQTARREFQEETGLIVPEEGLIELGEVRQKGGKRVLAWAFEGNCDPASIASNSFEIEWPPRSGTRQSFPEVDRAGFFTPDEARRKINAAQAAFIDRLEKALDPVERA